MALTVAELSVSLLVLAEQLSIFSFGAPVSSVEQTLTVFTEPEQSKSSIINCTVILTIFSAEF